MNAATLATDQFLLECYEAERGQIDWRDVSHAVLVEYLRSDAGQLDFADLAHYITKMGEVERVVELTDAGTRYPSSDAPHMAELGRIVVRALKRACAEHLNYQFEVYR